MESSLLGRNVHIARDNRQPRAYRFMVEDSIYLAPEARGRGIGKALLAELMERCTKLGFRQMVAVIGGALSAGAPDQAGRSAV